MQVWPALRNFPKAMLAAAFSSGKIGRHDHRRLATELERHPGEVGGGRLHHEPPDLSGAGEDQVVERQAGELLRDVGAAGHHRRCSSSE